MQLLIGSKNTSSWSMRAWIVMHEKGIPFEEVIVPMRSPDVAAQRLRARLPSGKVPCLFEGDMTVWETTAILEYLAEKSAGRASCFRSLCTPVGLAFRDREGACWNVGSR